MACLSSHFVFFRHWPGYASTFPFDRFNGLPDEGLDGALSRFAEEWIEQNQKDWSNRPEEVKERASKQVSPASLKTPRMRRDEAPKGHVMYEVGLASGMIDKLPSTGAPSPGPRHYFALVPEAVATEAVHALNRRHLVGWNPQFGSVQADELADYERAEAHLAVDQVREGWLDGTIMDLIMGPIREESRRYLAMVDRIEQRYTSSVERQKSVTKEEGLVRGRPRRGSRPRFDPKEDEALVDQWRASGMTRAEFEEKHGHGRNAVQRAQDRLRRRTRQVP